MMHASAIFCALSLSQLSFLAFSALFKSRYERKVGERTARLREREAGRGDKKRTERSFTSLFGDSWPDVGAARDRFLIAADNIQGYNFNTLRRNVHKGIVVLQL